jgi:hypothetical protein
MHLRDIMKSPSEFRQHRNSKKQKTDRRVNITADNFTLLRHGNYSVTPRAISVRCASLSLHCITSHFPRPYCWYHSTTYTFTSIRLTRVFWYLLCIKRKTSNDNSYLTDTNTSLLRNKLYNRYVQSIRNEQHCRHATCYHPTTCFGRVR